jgi:hypothetical protein
MNFFLVVLFVFILICDVFVLKEIGKNGKCGNFVTVRPTLFGHNLNVLSHSGIFSCSLRIGGGTADGWPVLPARYLSNVNKYPRKCHARSTLHVCRDTAFHTDPRSKGSKQVIARAVGGWFQICDVCGSPRCPPCLFLLLVCSEFRLCSFLQ